MPIEKKALEPRYEVAVSDEGKPYMKEIPQWEITASGKEVGELEGIFKGSAEQMMHDSWKEWHSIGEEVITKPDGSTDVVRGDHFENYRRQPGFCVKATKPTFTMSGFGSMKRDGILRQRVKWTREGKIIETVYSDGRKTLEEVPSGYYGKSG